MGRRTTDEAIFALIGLVYEAACDPRKWPEFLRACASSVDVGSALVHMRYLETLRASTASDGGFPIAACGFHREFLQTLEKYYNAVNGWARNERMRQCGRAVIGSVYPERKPPGAELHREWLRLQGYFHALSATVVQDGACANNFGSLRSRRAGDLGSEEMRLYEVLIPHILRAMQIQRRFSYLQSLSTASLSLLDTMPAAVMLLDSSARALHSNSSARRELQRGDPFRLGPSGEICVRGVSNAQIAVRNAIGAALDPTRGAKERLPTVAQVSRRNGEVLSVHALRLPHNARAERGAGAHRQIAACALVVHGVASRVPTVAPQLLRHVYGLTPAEARVAIAIGEGETIRRYAERRRISRNTVASQLKSVFDKTGLRRQSDLVRWLLQSGAAMSPEGGVRAPTRLR